MRTMKEHGGARKGTGGARKGAGRKSDTDRKKISNLFKRMMKKNFTNVDEMFEMWFDNIRARGFESKDMQLFFKYAFEYGITLNDDEDKEDFGDLTINILPAKSKNEDDE